MKHAAGYLRGQAGDLRRSADRAIERAEENKAMMAEAYKDADKYTARAEEFERAADALDPAKVEDTAAPAAEEAA